MLQRFNEVHPFNRNWEKMINLEKYKVINYFSRTWEEYELFWATMIRCNKLRIQPII